MLSARRQATICTVADAYGLFGLVWSLRCLAMVCRTAFWPMSTAPVILRPHESWQGKPALGLGWKIGTPTGWGVYGLNLALQLVRTGTYFPLPFDVDPTLLGPLQRILLSPVLAQHARMRRVLAEHQERKIAMNF